MTRFEVRVHIFATARSEGMEGCSKRLNFSRGGANLRVDVKVAGGKYEEEALDSTPLAAAEQVRDASKPVFLPRYFAAHAPL
jgi:hypothetical protein